MCERDDCSSILSRRTGQTIICAYLEEINPPTLKDHTGTYTLQCPLPNGSSFPVEKNDLYLFLLTFDGDQHKCTRITPIPGVLYPVYRKVLDDYRKNRMEAMRKMRK
ncbi:unnamed protein product [Caenorhabditis brenneri]